MKKFIKKLRWLIKNQEKIEKLLNKPVEEKKNTNNTYSVAGVPEFQLNYINDILGTDDTK